MNTVKVAPRASVLIESMRDIGYSLESALADIIDNAITAEARSIAIFAATSTDSPRLAIIDDGKGMSEGELTEAMRPGSRSPLAARDSHDLGRFGLGLKTASFSQCRRLTVVTRRGGKTSAARWDLDFVAKKDEWLIEIPDDPAAVPWVEHLGTVGTLVLWEELDRLTESEVDAETRQHLVRRLDEAGTHLELVFHRFLSGERGTAKVQISLNGRALMPFDPFHTQSKATIHGPVERIRVKGHDVTVQAFTLPHHKKVSPAEWERYAGKAGYTRNQGFYVYRGKRLIIHGTWFGLARQMEITKLARVRIDMPNELDNEWKIDVRKASAHPPRHVRRRLRRIIETIGATSRRVYSTRGHRLIAESRVPVWQRVQDKNDIRYRVNTEHPVLAAFLNGLDAPSKRRFLGALELVGAGLPVDSLFADIASQPERVGGAMMSGDAHQQAVTTTVNHLLKSGLSVSDITDMLRVTEPFRSAWSETQRMIDVLLKETGRDE